jgi:hypothetical protein
MSTTTIFIGKNSGIRADMAQFYSMKAVLERTLGKTTFEKLKDGGTLRDWKNALTKVLKAIELSVEATVAVADAEWRKEIGQLLENGRARLLGQKSIDELFAALSATLIEVAFLQLGRIPSNANVISNSSTKKVPLKLQRTIPLKPQYWTLRRFRSVQYVQTQEQQDNLRAYVAGRQANRLRTG